MEIDWSLKLLPQDEQNKNLHEIEWTNEDDYSFYDFI